MAKLLLQLWVGTEERWRDAATLWVDDERAGVRSPSRLEYDLDFLDGASDGLGATDSRALSCGFPISYDLYSQATWPAFLLDMIPTGAARRFWEAELGLPNAPSSDWAVLAAGGTNPPGNVRVLAKEEAHAPHPGFSRSDILERREHFIEYARAAGAPISGSSGAGGDSPKLLLREDHHGRWHADGALPDAQTRACFLVKFPRTMDRLDRIVLEAEAAYQKVAVEMGARANEDGIVWERDCLFAPRFDRLVHAGRRGPVERFGLESLASLAGVAEFGAPTPKETLATALARHATDREAELRELVLRDVLDVALGNTDNHARNTAVLKWRDRVELSPLYDFAPMLLDSRGVARVCRWVDRAEYPDWSRVADFLGTLGLDVVRGRRWLHELAARVAELPRIMTSCGVPKLVRERVAPRIQRVAHALEAVTS